MDVAFGGRPGTAAGGTACLAKAWWEAVGKLPLCTAVGALAAAAAAAAPKAVAVEPAAAVAADSV